MTLLPPPENASSYRLHRLPKSARHAVVCFLPRLGRRDDPFRRSTGDDRLVSNIPGCSVFCRRTTGYHDRVFLLTRASPGGR